MEKRIKEILIDIAEKTYGEKPKYFDLKIIKEERASFHGDYSPSKKVIRIFNLSRPTEHVISTTIHELAHHIDFCKYGSSGHNKRFYGIFRELLTTAIECGYVSYESIKNKKDSIDIIQMEKHFGEIVAYYDETKDTNKDKVFLKIKNSYNIKDFLYNNGFRFNATEKTWDICIKKQDVDSMKEKILEQDKSVEIIESDYNNINVEVFYYIIVSKNTFEKKEILAQNGYKYKGYNEKTNSWVKKINSHDLNNEKRFLDKIGLEYKLRK